MIRKALALVLSMSLLWCSTTNAVYASELSDAEEIETVDEFAATDELTEMPVVETEDETEIIVEDDVVDETIDEDPEAISGECGENLTWTLSGAGTLTISGTGEMEFENKYTAPWYNDGTAIGKIVIGDGVTSIADYAFEDCVNVTEVKIPESITTIGNLSFVGCESLEKVIIPNSVIELGYAAFEDCTLLKEVQLSNSLEKIDEAVFCNCESLESIEILEGVFSIGYDAFSECKSLKKVTFPSTLICIESDAFYGCSSLEKLVIPNSVTVIESSAFEACTNLKEVTISENLEMLDYWTFSECTSLEKVKIPSSVTSIEYGAFAHCASLTEVEIPNSVTSIAGKAFYNTAMQSVTLTKNVKTLGDLAVGYIDKDWEAVPVKGFTIFGYTNTKAESYANKNAFSFRNLGEEGAPNTLVIVHEKSEDKYVIGSGNDLTIYCTGDFDKFVSVEMDGVLVDPSNYTAVEGSTVITFTSSYLDTLSPGKHEVTINYVDDSVSTYIRIIGENGEGAEDINGPGSSGSSSGSGYNNSSAAAKTGDSANIAMWLILCAVALGVGGITVVRTKKMNK